MKRLVALQLVASIDAILACYAVAEDKWYLTGGRPGLKLPESKPAAADPSGPQNQSRIYTTAAGEVVPSPIDQTDPK